MKPDTNALTGESAAWIAGPAPDGSGVAPAPLLRTTFELAADVESATLELAAGGTAVTWVNGARTGPTGERGPATTDYESRVYALAYDVTDALHEGENVLAATLGRERYAMTTRNVWHWEDPPWHADRPCLLARLEVVLADGTTEVVETGGDWEVAHGPTRFDSLYEGERFDARERRPGWRTADDDSNWKQVDVVDGPSGEVVPQSIPSIREVRRVYPETVTEVEPGVHVVDFGEMIAGWITLHTTAEAGTEFRVRHGERLDANGTVVVNPHDETAEVDPDEVDLADAFGLTEAEIDAIDPNADTVEVDVRHVKGDLQTDTYTAAGDGDESWTPQFTYKGFRYVELVTENPDAVENVSVEAVVGHTPVEEGGTGSFRSGDVLCNRIHENTRRALLNNYHDIPTDTPVFEKNGWTGDAQLTATSALYDLSPAAFFRKWLTDIADSQLESGEIPPIVPTSGWGYSDPHGDGAIQSPNPAWDAAYPLITWWLYEFTGDSSVLEEHLEGLCNLVEYYGREHTHGGTGGITSVGLGDWLPPHGAAEGMVTTEGPGITGTAYYYRMAEVVADAAAVIGRTDTASKYRDLATDIADSLNEAFLDTDDGIYSTGKADEYRQTSNVLPLAFGVVPEDYRDAVVENLVADVQETHGSHLNTGILGTRYLLHVLTDSGHVDLAYEVATQTTYPSWGHWIVEDDATALYEHWRLDTRSRDHHMFGSIVDWFYRHLAGITPADPGFETVQIAPSVPAELPWAEATVETPYGEIFVRWDQTDDELELVADVPDGTTAHIHLPLPQNEDVTVSESGVDLENGVSLPEGIHSVQRNHEDNSLVVVGPGRYDFTI